MNFDQLQIRLNEIQLEAANAGIPAIKIYAAFAAATLHAEAVSCHELMAMFAKPSSTALREQAAGEVESE